MSNSECSIRLQVLTIVFFSATHDFVEDLISFGVVYCKIAQAFERPWLVFRWEWRDESWHGAIHKVHTQIVLDFGVPPPLARTCTPFTNPPPPTLHVRLLTQTIIFQVIKKLRLNN